MGFIMSILGSVIGIFAMMLSIKYCEDRGYNVFMPLVVFAFAVFCLAVGFVSPVIYLWGTE